MTTVTKDVVEKQVKNLLASGNSIYKLLYKKGNVLHEIYYVSKDKNTAMSEGRNYCDKRKLTFIYVMEWLQDIHDNPDPDRAMPV